MADIIFHIGLPKCASTTLQNKVFVNEKGYLGTHKNLRLEENFGKQFEFLTPTGPRFFGDIAGTQRIVNNIRHKFNKEFEDHSPYILSSELLSNRNKLEERPVIDFLKEFQDKVWIYGKVKVLLVLRNPASRIISEYAQISNRKFNAGQQDLERYVEKLLKDNRGIKYDKWVEELHSNFGKENICVLFMEEIGTAVFWENLKLFCKLKEFDDENWLKNSSTDTRKKNDRTWKIRPYDPNNKAHGIVSSIFALIWPIRLLPEVRFAVKKLVERMLAAYFIVMLKVLKANHGNTDVKLTNELEENIKRQFKSQVERLEALLKKDIKTLGY